ncbi:MAG: STAS/SEC14 domain-containing protein [Burkholderiales bacterium]|nr:STAS/SEC14 domain-containing protein [Burkholderiales bacterium]
MALTVRTEQHAGYAAARLSGAPTLDEMMAAVGSVAAESSAWPHGLLLVDLRGVTTLRAFTEQFTLGEQAAQKLGHLRRIASVVPEDRITRNSERPARKAGLDLRVFTDEAEALAWLLADEAGA